MPSFRLKNVSITTEKTGASRFRKSTQPIRIGKYSEIKTPEYEFHFNLKGEIKFIRGLNTNWPHPSEWLKRTDGNDWVFYSVGTATGGQNVKNWLGEYYLPCLPYPSNSIWSFNPFAEPRILQAYAAWSQLYGSLSEMPREGMNASLKKHLDLIMGKDESVLYKQAQKLHAITGQRISVLPPDTRHVDYEIIPLMIADGCLYQCGFCCVKSDNRFKPRSRESILRQIRNLKAFYGPNLGNYNAIFLGNHDGLAAGDELIRMAAEETAEEMGLGNRHVKDPMLYLFGSVDSFLKNGNNLPDTLNRLPYHTYINIGFESGDQKTLADLKKPLQVSRVQDAFQKMIQINREYPNLEVTGNFLLGEDFSPDHNQSLKALLGSVPDSVPVKGAVYLSPLQGTTNQPDLLKTFAEIKNKSRLPVYLYLIQRL